jgi:PAT family beta-lactamase induction signal transducer AmpG
MKFKNLIKWIKSLGIYGRRNVLTVFMLGITSGLPLALTAGTFRIWLTEIGITSSLIGIMSIVALPYSLKILWAPIIDNYSIPYLTEKLGRRKSWLIVTQIALIISIVFLGIIDPVDNLYYTGICALMVAFFSATQDIIINAYRIELLAKEEQVAGVASYIFGYRIGMLCTSAGALWLSQYYSWFVVYSSSALIIFFGIYFISQIAEPNNYNFNNVKSQNLHQAFYKAIIGSFKDFSSKPGWQFIILFTIFFKLGDAMAEVMTESFLIQIGFSKLELAKIVKLFGFCSTLIGVFIGGVMVYRLGMFKSLWICGILQMLTNLIFVLQAFVGYSPELLAVTIGAENLTGGMGATVFVSYLSSLCNLTYTGTQYAILSALSNIARTILAAPSGHLALSIGWVNFFIATTLAAFPGLILLYYMTKIVKNKVNQT